MNIAKLAGIAITWAWLSNSVAAQNLYPGDTSAECSPDIFTQGRYFSAGFLTAHHDDKEAVEGTHSARIDYDQHAESKALLKSLLFFKKRISFRETPVLENNATYTLSFYAKANQPKYRILLRLCPTLALQNRTIYRDFILTDQWQRYTLTFRTDFNGIQTKNNHFYSIGLDFNHGSGTVWLDALQLEKGNQATKFKTAQPASLAITVKNMHYGNVHLTDEPLELAVTCAQNRMLAQPELNVKITDWQGKLIRKLKAEWPPSGKHIFTLKDFPLGWFQVTASVTDQNREVASQAFEFISIQKPVKLDPGVRPFCGGYTWGIFKEDELDFARMIGVKRFQIHARWSWIERQRGQYDWTLTDKAFEWAKKRGMTIKVGSTLAYTPVWAQVKQDVKSTYYPRRLFLPQRQYKQDYLNFIRAVVERYGNQIECFELEGELNGYLGIHKLYMERFPESLVKDSNGQQWVAAGEPFELCVDFIGSAAKMIREIAPNMNVAVLRPSQGQPGTPWMFVRRWMKRLDKYATVFPTDTYLVQPFMVGPDIQVERRGDILDDRLITMKYIREMTAKPTYMSESGLDVDIAIPGDSSHRQFQAEILVKDFMTCRALGFYAYDWYRTVCMFSMKQYQSALFTHGQLASAAAAYSAVAQQVENVIGGQYLKMSTDVRAAVLEKTDHTGVAAIWSPQPASIPIPPDCRLKDMMGNEIKGENGRITLGNAPCFLEANSYDRLLKTLEKTPVRPGKFCEIRFKRAGKKHGILQFLNKANLTQFVLTVNIKGLEQDYTVCLSPAGKRNLKIPLTEGLVQLRGTVCNEYEPTMALDFAFDVPTVTAIGTKPAVIAQTNTMNDLIQSDILPPWDSPADLSMRLYASWDQQALRLRAVVNDDAHHHAPELMGWQADGFHLAICPLNDAAFTPKSGNSRHGKNDLETCLYLLDDGTVKLDHYYGAKRLELKECSVKRDNREKNTTYELTIPWAKLGTVPHKGMTFGMSVILPDDDTGHGKDYDAFVGGGIFNGKDAAKYRLFILD